MIPQLVGTKRKVGVTAAAVAIAVAGGAWAVAGSGEADHPRDEGAKAAAGSARITGHSFGTLCRMGYDTQSSTLTPPDDSTADNVPAATVSFKKTCVGAVTATLSAETSTTAAGAFIHLDMRATCTGTGGLSNPCTVGQQIFGSPGHTFFQNVQAGVQVHSATMVWTGLPKGVWRFDALPGGGQSANLQFRTFTVQSYKGG